MEFNFNNTNIGSIDEMIVEKFYDKQHKLNKVKLDNGLILNVYKYKTAFPLILEEVKPLFNLSKVKYNIVIIRNFLITQYLVLRKTPLIRHELGVTLLFVMNHFYQHLSFKTSEI